MNTLLYCFMLFAHGIAADSSYTATIPLSGSAYNHAGGETKVYFLATHTGRLQVQVRGRSGQAVPVLVKLDGVASRDTTIRLPASGGEFLIDISTRCLFEVQGALDEVEVAGFEGDELAPPQAGAGTRFPPSTGAAQAAQQ